MTRSDQLAILIVAMAAVGCQRADRTRPAPSYASEVDGLFTEWNRSESPGCAVGISRDGKVEYSRGYGMANLETATPITPASVFHVASISKQITAFSVGLLAQDGKLSLDDEVHKYVPELPDYGTPITIRHLIYHTSGLRDQWDLARLAGWRPDDVITEADVLDLAVRQRNLNFAPGTEWQYNNTAYTLLALIVNRVSGRPLRDFAEERVFRPLGMRDTHFHDDHAMIVKGRTSAYAPRSGGAWRISIPVFDTYGPTSLFANVRDLLTWEDNFRQALVGGEVLVREAQTSGTLADGSSINYGFGVAVGAQDGFKWVGHAGADAGYRADVIAFPGSSLAVAVLCNASTAIPARLTRQVARILLPRLTARSLAQEYLVTASDLY